MHKEFPVEQKSRVFIHALNWTWTFGPPLLLLPKISIMQYSWAIAGIQFLVTIDKIIIFPILGSCTVCLPFRQPPPEGSAVSLLGGGAAVVSQSTAHSSPRRESASPPLTSPVLREIKSLRWQTEIRYFLSQMKKQVPESPWVCVPEVPPLLESRQEGSSGWSWRRTGKAEAGEKSLGHRRRMRSQETDLDKGSAWAT